MSTVQSKINSLLQYLQFQCIPADLNELLVQFEIPNVCYKYIKDTISNLDFCSIESDGMITVDDACLKENICKSARYFELSDQKWLVLKQIVQSRSKGIFQHDLANLINMNNKTVFFQVKSLLSEGIIIKEQRPLDRRPALWLIHVLFYEKESAQELSVPAGADTKNKLIEMRDLYSNKFKTHQLGNNEARKMICSVLSVVENQTMIFNDLLYVLYGSAFDEGLSGKDRRYVNRLLLQLVDENYCKTFMDQTKQRCVKLLKQYVDILAGTRSFLPMHLKDKNTSDNASIHYSQYLSNSIEELIISQCLASNTNGITSSALVSMLRMSPKSLDRYLFKLVGAKSTYPNSFALLKTVVNHGKSRLATYFHPSVIDNLSREYVVSRSFAKPTVKPVYTILKATGVFSGFVKRKDKKKLYANKYLGNSTEITEIEPTKKRKAIPPKVVKKQKIKEHADAVDEVLSNKQVLPPLEDPVDLIEPISDLMQIDLPPPPSPDVMDLYMDTALHLLPISMPNLSTTILNQYQQQKDNLPTTPNMSNITPLSYMRKMYIYLLVNHCAIVEVNKEFVQFINHDVLGNQIKKMDKKTINSDLEWLKSNKFINKDVIMLPKLSGGLIKSNVIYRTDIDPTHQIFREFIKITERGYYQNTKKNAQALPMDIEPVEVENVFDLINDNNESSHNQITLAGNPYKFLPSKYIRCKLFHGHILKNAPDTPILNILEIIKSLTIHEYIQLFPMDGTIDESVIDYVKSNLDATLYNNPNIPIPICDANKLKYHLRMLLNIMISLCLLVPKDTEDPNNELEWLNRQQLDYSPIEFKLNLLVPLYSYETINEQISRTYIRDMPCANEQQLNDFWTELEQITCKSNRAGQTRKLIANTTVTHVLHPLYHINKLRSWSIKLDLTQNNKTTLQSYCSLDNNNVICSTPYHNMPLCKEIALATGIDLTKLRQYFRLLESDYLQLKINRRLNVTKMAKTKTKGFQQRVIKQRNSSQIKHTRTKTVFTTEQYLQLIVMVLLIKYYYKQVSWYHIAMVMGNQKEFGDKLRRLFGMIQGKVLGKLVIGKIQDRIVQHPIDTEEVPADLKSFELMKWTEWLINDLPENVKNDLKVALTPVKYHQNALGSNSHHMPLFAYPESPILPINLSINENTNNIAMLIRMFLNDMQSNNMTIYAYCIQHNIQHEALDEGISRELEIGSILKDETTGSIKINPQYKDIYSSAYGVDTDIRSIDMTRISGHQSMQLIQGMIGGSISVTNKLEATSVGLIPKQTKNTLDLLPKLEVEMKDLEINERRTNTNIETNRIQQHMDMDKQKQMFYKASMFVFNLIKQRPGMRKSEISKIVKIGVDEAELDLIMGYLMEMEILRKEEIEMEVIGIFERSLRNEEFYYCCKDAYKKMPAEMSK